MDLRKIIKTERLYEDRKIVLEKFDNGDYRVTFFRDDHHWGGDIIFNEKDGVIHDDVKDDDAKINEEELDKFAEHWCPESGSYREGDIETQRVIRNAYKAGYCKAIEQHKLDLEKACEWLDNNLFAFVEYDQLNGIAIDHDQLNKQFRKAMEE